MSLDATHPSTDLPFELAIAVAALATPRVAVLASTRLLADTVRQPTSALVQWFGHTLPDLLDDLDEDAPAFGTDGSMLPWQTDFARYVRLRLAMRHRLNLPAGPTLDLDLFRALFSLSLRCDPSCSFDDVAVSRERQLEHVAKLARAAQLECFFRRVSLQGLVSDGLVLALYFEAAESDDELTAALTLMAKRVPVIAFHRALPAHRMLAMLPDCAPAVYERVAALAGELGGEGDEDSEDSEEEDEEVEPILIDFFTLVAFSAACHWNLPALKAVAALHPDFTGVVAFLSHHRVANAFLGLVNEYPADRVLPVLEWLFKHGFSMPAATGPDAYVSCYLSPLNFGPDVLRAVFTKYDKARPLDPEMWATTRHVMERLAPWVEQGYDRELAQLLRAWPGTTDVRPWAVLVAAAIHAHRPMEQLRRMVNVVVKEQRDALVTELFAHVKGTYRTSKSAVSQICTLARACTSTPLSQLLAPVLVARSDAFLGPEIVTFADGALGPDLGTLGLGSRDERLALARTLLAYPFPALREPNCAHALVGILVPLLATPSSARAAMHHLAGKREQEGERDWTEVYASFISAMAGARHELVQWGTAVAGPRFPVSPEFLPAFEHFLALCPTSVVTPALAPRVAQDLVSIARAADPGHDATGLLAKHRGREVAAAHRFLQLLIGHSPATVGGLWGSSEGEIGTWLLPLIARHFPAGALDAFVPPDACAEAIVWEAGRSGKANANVILQVFRVCPATARDPACLRAVAEGTNNRDWFDKNVVLKVPGLARAMREAVEGGEQSD
ncbi:hypothetical protein H9P43_000256 [Blastocladiella emersonii ATCC 22665]|nr:hypothetical protein H9P43_000256 [Blastocladiella emersonii ATCC 22665]